MSEPSFRHRLTGFVSPVCLVLLLLASLLVVQLSESAVLQQRHVGLLTQQLAAERVARGLLHRAPVDSPLFCQITEVARCAPGDEALPNGTQLQRLCERFAEASWRCLAKVDALAVGGPREVVQLLLQEREQ